LISSLQAKVNEQEEAIRLEHLTEWLSTRRLIWHSSCRLGPPACGFEFYAFPNSDCEGLSEWESWILCFEVDMPNEKEDEASTSPAPQEMQWYAVKGAAEIKAPAEWIQWESDRQLENGNDLCISKAIASISKHAEMLQLYEQG
jgi:hypothetical protein